VKIEVELEQALELGRERQHMRATIAQLRAEKDAALAVEKAAMERCRDRGRIIAQLREALAEATATLNLWAPFIHATKHPTSGGEVEWTAALATNPKEVG